MTQPTDLGIINDKLVLEIENYHGITKAVYLVNTHTLTIEKKDINDPHYDIIHTVAPDVETLIAPIEDEYEIADIDDDYIYNTEYPLIRLQQLSLKDSLLIYDSPKTAIKHIGERPFVIYDTKQDAINDYFHQSNHEMIVSLLDETTTDEIKTTEQTMTIKSWLFHANPNFVEFPNGKVLFVSDFS